MNGSNRNLIAAVGALTFIIALTIVCAGSASAQGAGEKAIARMTIPGVVGDGPGGTIKVFGFTQLVTNPPPSGTGDAPPTFSLVVTKKIDPASPHMFYLSTIGRDINVKIVWTRINSATNQEEFSQSITITNILITSVRQRPANTADPEASQSDEYEEVTLLFRASTGDVIWETIGRTPLRIGWDFGRGVQK